MTEKQIEADVASYLGWCSMGLPFRLLDINEQATGADKLSEIVVPIYMQFKVSHGLRRFQSVELKRRKNESPLQEIRCFRAANSLADNPSMYFQLRAKAAETSDFQHNVLMAHNRPTRSYAIYVAPLILDRDEYYSLLCSGPKYLLDPWHWRDGQLLTSRGPHIWPPLFDVQPFLRTHVSIAPHQRVDTHKHYYAFSKSGDEVSWHSPEPIEGGPFRLSDFLTLRLRQLLDGAEELPSADQALSVADDFLSDTDLSLESIAPVKLRLRGSGTMVRGSIRTIPYVKYFSAPPAIR